MYVSLELSNLYAQNGSVGLLWNVADLMLAVFWVIVTFATSAVKNTHQLYACRFLVSLPLLFIFFFLGGGGCGWVVKLVILTRK